MNRFGYEFYGGIDHFYASSHAESNSLSRYQWVLNKGNQMMVSALVTLMLSVVVCYTHYENFPLSLQVIGHIAIIIAVTAIKIGYLMRCIGRHGLGKQL